MKLLLITPTLNEEQRIVTHLENVKCFIESLAKYILVEAVFIDGGSRDNTKQILEKENLISKPGSNIYAAFNIGIKFGLEKNYDHIMFLGVGDALNHCALDCKKHTNTKFFYEKQGWIIYGDFLWSNGKRINSEFNLNNGRLGFPHSGTIFPISLFDSNYFNEDYQIAGDLDWLIRSWHLMIQLPNHKTTEPFVTLLTDGVSMSNSRKHLHLREYLLICLTNKTIPSLKVILKKII